MTDHTIVNMTLYGEKEAMTDFELIEKVAKWLGYEREPPCDKWKLRYYTVFWEGKWSVAFPFGHGGSTHYFEPLNDWNDLMTKVVPKLPERYVICICGGTFDLYDSEYTSPIPQNGNLSDLPRAVCELVAILYDGGEVMKTNTDCPACGMNGNILYDGLSWCCSNKKCALYDGSISMNVLKILWENKKPTEQKLTEQRAIDWAKIAGANQRQIEKLADEIESLTKERDKLKERLKGIEEENLILHEKIDEIFLHGTQKLPHGEIQAIKKASKEGE